jgi:hypothetical protein
MPNFHETWYSYHAIEGCPTFGVASNTSWRRLECLYFELHCFCNIIPPEEGWGDVDWIGLSKDRNRWRALVNSVLNLRVP